MPALPIAFSVRSALRSQSCNGITTFSVPRGAVGLASSDACANQAFRWGYKDFDSGVAKKFVINPNGLIKPDLRPALVVAGVGARVSPEGEARALTSGRLHGPPLHEKAIGLGPQGTEPRVPAGDRAALAEGEGNVHARHVVGVPAVRFGDGHQSSVALRTAERAQATYRPSAPMA
jgi:hypothetical protein